MAISGPETGCKSAKERGGVLLHTEWKESSGLAGRCDFRLVTSRPAMRQLSFAFLQSRRHTTDLPASVAPSRPVTLRRIEPAKNMARFYALEVGRDLFGRLVLVRRWGRIGTAGKIRLDEHKGEGEALTALQKLHAAKKRRGYQ